MTVWTMIFVSYDRMQIKVGASALFWLADAKQPPSRSLPTPARLSLEIKLHGAVGGCDHFVPVRADVHLLAAVVALPGFPLFQRMKAGCAWWGTRTCASGKSSATPWASEWLGTWWWSRSCVLWAY